MDTSLDQSVSCVIGLSGEQAKVPLRCPIHTDLSHLSLSAVVLENFWGTDSFPPQTSMSVSLSESFSRCYRNLPSPSAECSQELGVNTLRDHPQPVRDGSLWTNHLLASLSPGGRILTRVPRVASEGPSRPELQLPTVESHSLTLCWLFSHLLSFPCSLTCFPWYPFPNTLPASKALSQGLALSPNFPNSGRDVATSFCLHDNPWALNPEFWWHDFYNMRVWKHETDGPTESKTQREGPHAVGILGSSPPWGQLPSDPDLAITCYLELQLVLNWVSVPCKQKSSGRMMFIFFFFFCLCFSLM